MGPCLQTNEKEPAIRHSRPVHSVVGSSCRSIGVSDRPRACRRDHAPRQTSSARHRAPPLDGRPLELGECRATGPVRGCL